VRGSRGNKKHFYLLLVFVATSCLLLSDLSYSQVFVPLSKETGSSVFKIRCRVNGLAFDFLLDTGAEDLVLTQDVVKRLTNDGLVTQQDFQGKQTYRLANGSIIQCSIINIRELELGGITISNVRAAIIESNDGSPMLLGQSALSRLGTFTVDVNNELIKIEPSVTNVLEGKDNDEIQNSARYLSLKDRFGATFPNEPSIAYAGSNVEYTSVSLLDTMRFAVSVKKFSQDFEHATFYAETYLEDYYQKAEKDGASPQYIFVDNIKAIFTEYEMDMGMPFIIRMMHFVDTEGYYTIRILSPPGQTPKRIFDEFIEGFRLF